MSISASAPVSISRSPRPSHRVLVVHNEGIDVDDGDITRRKEAEDEVVEVADQVVMALEALGYSVARLAVGTDLAPLRARLDAGDVDVVFNLVESLGGDAAREPEVPALLTARGVHFTGNPAAVLKRALAKDEVRAALMAHGVPVPPAVVVTVDNPLPPPEALGLTWPLFVKPARVDGSIGIDQGSVVLNPAALQARVALLLATFGGAVLVEEYLPGAEVNVAVCPSDDGVICAPTMLDFSGFVQGQWPVVTYDAKWVAGSLDYNCQSVAVAQVAHPQQPPLAPGVREAVIAMAQQALAAVGADGYARVDARLDRNGRPMIIDVNPNPALHPDAGMAVALRSIGIEFVDVIDSIVQHALQRRAPVQLRDLRHSDRLPLQHLLQGVGNLNDDERAVAMELIDETLNQPTTSTYRFFVAVDDDADDASVLGYLCWGRTPMTARTVDLYWIVVDQTLQGKGVGRRLLSALEQQVAAEGLLTIRVETASSEAYAGTIAFYEKTGFVLSGRIADFYADGDDLLIFTKRVG